MLFPIILDSLLMYGQIKPIIPTLKNIDVKSRFAMTEKTLSKIMTVLIVVGLSIAAFGLGLAIFTDMVSKGTPSDIMLIALLIAGGLVISVPAKIYLTFQLMKRNDEKLRKH